VLRVGLRRRRGWDGRLSGDDRVSPSVCVQVGSGVGKLVLALPLLTHAHAVGIEIDDERAASAEAALRDARTLSLLSEDEASRLQLRHGDALAQGAIPANTTLVYISNLCFPPALSGAIAARLLTLPKLQCVAASLELDPSAAEVPVTDDKSSADAHAPDLPIPEAPTAPRPGCRLVLQRTLQVSNTWDEHSRLHVYCVRCDT
jgi:hypothetical protein